MSELIKYVKSLSGYKISQSHYRLGSKLHISEFYYAKRFFQNNFYASRFAFMLTQEILASVSAAQLKVFKKEGLSLIGYGMYSELLLTLVEKFLKKDARLAGMKINHNLVSDVDETSFIKSEPFWPNALIIVPIASTFSTGIKIEEMLIRQNKDIKVVSPHFNIIHVSDSPEHAPLSELEKDFGWIAKDAEKKTITLKAFFDNNETEKVQKYFICLPTQWLKIEDCKECFPQEEHQEAPLKEKPLFVTDQSSVTPSIIFDFPKGRLLDEEDLKRTFILTPKMIQYGHHTRNNNHFIYSVDTETFLTSNLDQIKTWLEGIRAAEDFRKAFPEYAHVLIISSCHYSNAGFITVLNEELFSSSANVLHYDPDHDYIQNFEMIYGAEIQTADKIIFVDDSLKSASTFSKINEFVQHILIKKRTAESDHTIKATKGIDACMLLINKSQQFTHEIVKEKLVGLKKIYGFANLHLFTALSFDNNSSIVQEESRYKTLIADSFLDSLKIHFIRQAGKLNAKFKPPTDELKRERHLTMLEATHRIYQYFSITPIGINEQLSFKVFLDNLDRQTKSPFINSAGNKQAMLQFRLIDSCILKVLTQSPFTQYEPLKKIVFKWVINLLDEHIGEIQEALSNGKFSLQHFKDLKFFMRRAGLLNSNYLISKKMLATLKALYSTKGLQTIITAIKASETDPGNKGLFTVSEEMLKINEANINDIKEFHVFYAAQVKELLLQNEARSIRLEKIFNTEGAPVQPGYQQIVRILREENSIVILKFYEFLIQNEKWPALYNTGIPDAPIVTSNDPIIALLNLAPIKRHHRFRLVEDFFDLTGQEPPLKNIAFLNYLWIQYFIRYDSQKNYLPLTIKTDFICQKLEFIIGPPRPGIFLIIKDARGKAYLAYDKNPDGISELDVTNWNNPEDGFLTEFLDGSSDDQLGYNKTIIELKKNSSLKKWEDMYSTSGKKAKDNLRYSFLPEDMNRLILLRLSKRSLSNEEKAQGVIGFYFNSRSANITPLNRIRYLLLLKNSLSDFVERHHQNNEFRDWLIAENTKRLALLSGHGKEMLKDISMDDESFRTIALNLEHLQMIILVNQFTMASNGMRDIKKKFEQFYHVSGATQITEKYLTSLYDMAEKIYFHYKIETIVHCDITHKILKGSDTKFKFAFNKNILDLICFELLINAKKNRWHFLEQEEISGFKKNILNISLGIINPPEGGGRKLQLQITNIGPTVGKLIIDKLNNRYQNVKSNDLTAGTTLTKILVFDILNSEIKFETRPINAEQFLSYFTVTVTLKEMS